MLKITICIGSSCHLKGSRLVVEQMKELIAAHQLQSHVDLAGQFCMGNCQNGVCLAIGTDHYSLMPNDTKRFFEEHVLPRLNQPAVFEPSRV